MGGERERGVWEIEMGAGGGEGRERESESEGKSETKEKRRLTNMNALLFSLSMIFSVHSSAS